MKFSRACLQKYFIDPLPPAEVLAEALTFHAFEIEAVTTHGDDSVIDVKVTPNRGHDGLCHRGIAKELSVILDQPLKHDPLRTEVSLEPRTAELEVEIADTQVCKRFSAAVIKNITVGPSPEWLQSALEAIGQRSINNIVDATNYVMWDLGQPLHAFDADTLGVQSGKRKIVVRTAGNGEMFTALDAKQYTPTDKDLFITDGNRGVLLGMAGIKGGKQAEVSGATKNIVIESANFNGVRIRKTSQRLKLRTDASLRFENEIAPELTAYGLVAVTDLILQIAGGKVAGFVDVYPQKQQIKAVSISVAEINRLLGLQMTVEEVAAIFARFAFAVAARGETFTVTPPFERLDLVTTEDLIEEVGRIYGYEKIAPVIPEPIATTSVNKRFYYAEKIRSFLLARGFSEVYTGSFKNEGAVALANAVASDKNFLRRELTPGLHEALAMNAHNMPLLGVNAVNLFELGTVFTKNGGEIYALAFGSWMGESVHKRTEAVNFIQKVRKELAAFLSVELDVSGGYLFETNLTAIIEKLPTPTKYENSEVAIYDISYQPFSAYPFVLRDIAVWVQAGVAQNDVETLIRREAGELLVRLHHFDTFEKEGRVSHAFHLVFQSHERTLSDSEINDVMKKTVVVLEQNGWRVR